MAEDPKREKTPVRTKDPDAVEDYPINWERYLQKTSDDIVSSVWLIESDPARTLVNGTDLTVDSSEIVAPRAVAWLSAGVPGRAYIVTNRIITTQGRTADQSIRILIKHK